MTRPHLLYLEDMQAAMERISRYCAGLGFAAFSANELVIDAVVRNLEVIGEAAKKVPLPVQQLYPQLPWSQMYRMRNRISHEYFGLDLAYYLAGRHVAFAAKLSRPVATYPSRAAALSYRFRIA